jgi:hypothetical protein
MATSPTTHGTITCHTQTTITNITSTVQNRYIKTTRTDQLCPVINDEGEEAVILGKGCFGVCKLMSLHVSGECALVFVFGVALDIDPKLLIMEFCGLTDSKCSTVFIKFFVCLHGNKTYNSFVCGNTT